MKRKELSDLSEELIFLVATDRPSLLPREQFAPELLIAAVWTGGTIECLPGSH